MITMIKKIINRFLIFILEFIEIYNRIDSNQHKL
jgi:hypothetical protein